MLYKQSFRRLATFETHFLFLFGLPNLSEFGTHKIKVHGVSLNNTASLLYLKNDDTEPLLHLKNVDIEAV